MITKSNPFLRNDYYPDQNDIDELNTRINEVQSDVDLLAISVNEKTEAVNGRLNTLQNDYNESFETESLKSNLADFNVLNVNVQATIKDLDAEDTYTENLIVNKPVQDLALRNPHLENATSVNGNFYEPKIIGGKIDNIQFENIQNFKAINIEADEVKANKLIGDFYSTEPISSSAAVGYDENGRLIPIKASYDVSFPEDSDYLRTDAQGIARKGISESEVVQSTNLIQAGAVQNMYDAVNANFNDTSNSFNAVIESFNDVNNHFSNVELSFNNVDNNFNDISNSFNEVNNSFSTNYLTVNDNVVVDGNNFTHKGFDVTSMTVISEDEYNNLGEDMRNQTFYMTTPNGNLYFHGVKFAATNLLKEYTAYVSLPDMANAMNSLTTSTLTFTSGEVVNAFVNNGAYVNIWKKTPIENIQDVTALIGTQANTGSIITNANVLYITNAAGMYRGCSKLTDTFICNPALITGAPDNYDPMKYCTDMSNTFYGCSKLNQPIQIPNSVTSMYHVFEHCDLLNSPIQIPNSVTSMDNTFAFCYTFNQNIQIPNSVTSMDNTFAFCYTFNQNIQIPNSVTSMNNTFRSCNIKFNFQILIPEGVINMCGTFANCKSLNKPIIIPNTVSDMSGIFDNCRRLNQNIPIPSSATDIGGVFSACTSLNQDSMYIYSQNVTNMDGTFMGTTINTVHIPISVPKDTSNYMYNCLVNGNTGITFTADRIFNDLPVDIDHWPPENV